MRSKSKARPGRYRSLNVSSLLSKLTLYSILSLLTVSAYILLVGGFSLILGTVIPLNYPPLMGLMIFLLVVLFNPLHSWVQAHVDTLFYRERLIPQARLQSFTRELTQRLELPAISRLVRQHIQQSLQPSLLHIFVQDPLSGQYLAQPDDDGQPTTDLRFPQNSALVQALSRRRKAILTSGSETLPTLLQTERARLALLNAHVFIPLPGQQGLVGWLAIGHKRSGGPYTSQELGFLEALGDQAALAIERAQVVADLERRVREMDILSRIAQGINVTLNFDDILELIYTQTNFIIPTQDFKIALVNPANQTCYFAFYLEKDERLRERENIPIAPDQTLEEIVIRNRRSILTDDYEIECRTQGIVVHNTGLFAWMGVPLNAAAETIGALSLASRDPAVIFTDQQRQFLQAIADQAAGAIVKARLLQEAERRAHQLATLNEISRSLTSTLEIKPLLNKILQSASEILNCEAGSLFMIDEKTDELVFEVTVGPVADDLVGQRLPPGTGIVGKSALSGQPVIANDVRHSQQGWFDQPDKKTGFVTRDLLVVPMKVKERVIGVIEVINKKDGSPFNLEDQELLAAFASQAAIALENARLYTQTDAALSARVDELSIMQRIDRELNATLDLEQVMRITLDWSLRQSEADAGLIGLFESSGESTFGIRVMAYHGYTTELDRFRASEENAFLISLDSPALQKALEEGFPQRVSFNLSEHSNSPEAEDGHATQVLSRIEAFTLLQDAREMVTIPIRRRAEVIGVLLLESKESERFTDEIIAFLSRLSDHAAIAISNAQLYADLQAANLAKSEFISLVSHELKTPMTSIRGYTDLLAQGAVGPVNETQANFLNTIRSNVNRMATLVSDLADISRIESGRMRLEFAVVSPSEVIQEVVRSAQAQINEKKQNLSIDIPDDLPPVWGDYNRLVQILANLLSNANKYTPSQGNITISARKTTHQRPSQSVTDVVVVSVQDSGYGITPQDQQKIFQKFFRSEDPKIREAPGTGLGLNITRHLVEMQGGQIWFDSQPGKGTTFYFTVPVAETP